MKKMFFVCFLASAFISLLQAQDRAAVTGTVKDATGKVVPFAFLRNAGTTQAAYADSAGSFVLAIPANTNLQVSAPGYTDMKVNTGSNTDLQIVMQADGKDNKAVIVSNNALKPVTIGGYSDPNNPKINLQPGFTFFASKKENAQGSPYLFDYWVHGFVISPQDSLVQKPNYLFNYDKIAGDVLLLQDNTSMGKVDGSQIKSVCLFDNHGDSYILEKIPGIDDKHYTQVLSSGKKIRVYKLIKTRFQKSDFETNGITSRGNKFDSFIDEPAYYVYNVQTKQVQLFTLKKKSIKAAFNIDSKKADTFFDANTGDINDNYLSKLGDFMNQ